MIQNPRSRQTADVTPAEAEPKGLVCAKCGCRHFRVIYLKRLPKGVLMRRRECRHCGRRVCTREQIC